MIFTASYALYQVVCLPVNFTGRGLRPGRPSGPDRSLAPARLPGGGHLPADLRRADRDAAQHLDGGLRAAGRPTRARPRPYVLDDGPSDEARDLAASLGLDYIRRPGQRRAQEERQPALRLRPDHQRVHRHPGRRLRAPARLPGRDPALHGRPFHGDRPDPAVLPGAAPSSPGSRTRRGRSRRCSTGRSRSAGIGSAPRSASGRPRSTGGPRWRPQGGAALIPYAEDVHTGLNVHAGRLVHRLPADRAGHRDLPDNRWTRSCASSTAGARATWASCAQAGCGR